MLDELSFPDLIFLAVQPIMDYLLFMSLLRKVFSSLAFTGIHLFLMYLMLSLTLGLLRVFSFVRFSIPDSLSPGFLLPVLHFVTFNVCVFSLKITPFD